MINTDQHRWADERRIEWVSTTQVAMQPGDVFVIETSLNAEIITDGTVGSVQVLTDLHYQIEQSLGCTEGSNLFHNFQYFTLSHAESATFTVSDTIRNGG